MTFVSELTIRLTALGKRARANVDKPDLTPAIGVIGDLGRLITKSTPHDIKSIQAAVASLRDALDREQARNHPTSALAGAASREYLAGAMWAINEVMTARLDALDSAATLPGRKTRKNKIEQFVLAHLDPSRGTSPTDLMSHPTAKKLGVKKYDISRVLGDLLGRDLIRVVTPAEDADRRNRYFALTDLGTVAAGLVDGRPTTVRNAALAAVLEPDETSDGATPTGPADATSPQSATRLRRRPRS